MGHFCNYCNKGVRSPTWEFKATGIHMVESQSQTKQSKKKGRWEAGGGGVILSRNRNKKTGKSCQVKVKLPMRWQLTLPV